VLLQLVNVSVKEYVKMNDASGLHVVIFKRSLVVLVVKQVYIVFVVEDVSVSLVLV